MNNSIQEGNATYDPTQQQTDSEAKSMSRASEKAVCLTYRTATRNKIGVYLNGKRVGDIVRCVGGWNYKTGACVGESFPTIAEVKRSLELPA